MVLFGFSLPWNQVNLFTGNESSNILLNLVLLRIFVCIFIREIAP